MTEFPHPLRLAVGSHKRGSGAGCAMNVISYENGDTEITDYPECSARPLSRMVQYANDTICKHNAREGGTFSSFLEGSPVVPTFNPTYYPTLYSNGGPLLGYASDVYMSMGAGPTTPERATRLLCSDCSKVVLDLGHATVGTGSDGPEVARAWAAELLVNERRGAIFHADSRHKELIEGAASILRKPETQSEELTVFKSALTITSNFGGAASMVALSSGAANVLQAALAALKGDLTATAAFAMACRPSANFPEYTAWAIEQWHRIAGTTASTVAETVVVAAVAEMAAAK